MMHPAAVLSRTDLPEVLVAVLDDLRHVMDAWRQGAGPKQLSGSVLRRARLERELRAAQSQGQLSPARDAATVAADIIAVRDGLLLQWTVDPDAVDVLAVMEDHLRRLDAAE